MLSLGRAAQRIHTIPARLAEKQEIPPQTCDPVWQWLFNSFANGELGMLCFDLCGNSAGIGHSS